MSPLEVVVLCGGLGTRLRSVVSDVPKPMAPVAGRPFLEILLAQIASLGAARAVLSTGYRAEAVAAHFGTHFRGLELAYAAEAEPLGTGGAARAGAQLCGSETVLVCNGDTFVEFDADAACGLCARASAPVVVTVTVEDTQRYGRIEVAPDGAARFAGRGIGGRGSISAGIYLVPRAALAGSGRPSPFSMEDLVFGDAWETPVRALPAHGRFIDIGLPEDYHRAQSMFAPR